MTGENLKVIKLNVSNIFAVKKGVFSSLMNQYLWTTDNLWERNAPLKYLSKKELNLTKSSNHGLDKVFKILLKRKIIYTQKV